MSNKVLKSRASYIKNWNAVIAGCCLVLSAPAAQAADDGRLRFRDFRDMNQGIDRRALRQAYRDQMRGNSNSDRFTFSPISDATSSHKHPCIDPNSSVKVFQLAESGRSLNRTVQQNFAGQTIRLSNGVNLDLSSTSSDITLGEKLFGEVKSVEISVGGEKKIVAAGSKVTAAEYVAVKQVLTGQGQRLTLSSTGTACGGDLDLGALTSDNDVLRASNLVVPANVTTRGDFSKGSDFRLLGDLNNYGTVYAFDADGKGRGGAIRAQDILNAHGAQINSDVDLALAAQGDLVNYGSITSAGNLTLTAGGAVKNSSTISAQKNLNVSSAQLSNSGTLSSNSGDVNIDAPDTSALSIVNTQGRIEALNGAINVRNASYNGTFDTTISGGDLLSKELNLNAGQATVNVDVNQLTGVLNEKGNASHVLASTDLLSVGSVCLTGDPTFVNDTGGISFGSNLQVGENLTVIARDDISIGSNVILAANSATQGYDITLIAGANITSTVGGATIDGTASANGGSIMVGSGAYIYASPIMGPGNLNAGNVYMYAFRGSFADSGRVDFANGIVVTSGSGSGLDGNCTIVAGGQNVGLAPAVNLGSIGSAGSSLNSTLSVTTAQPTSSGGAITYDVSGNRTSAAQLIASGSLNTDAGVAIRSYIVAGSVSIAAGDYIHYTSTLGPVIASSATLSSGGNGVGQETAYVEIMSATAAPFNLTAQATGGDVWVAYLSGSTLNLGSSLLNQHYTVSAIGPISVAGNISGTGTLSLTTNDLKVDGTQLAFHNIFVQSPSGYGLTVDGGTGGLFSVTAGGTMNLTATNLDLTLHNPINFSGGNVNFTVADNASGNKIVNTGVMSGDTFNTLTINACNVTGGGTTTNFASVVLNCDCGTIANSGGDVNLAQNFVFTGKDLAILAFGNVNTTGATLIDVSDPTGNGGNVTILAGFTFTPTTSGQVQDTRTYQITGTNPAGGSINLSSVNIITSGGNGFASGSVTAVANAGSSPSNIYLGNINTSGDTGGAVKIISQGNAFVQDIVTNGTSSSGAITVAAAGHTIVGGPIQVQDGVVSGGTFEIGSASAGSISVGNINAPGQTVTLYGAQASPDSIGQITGTSLLAYRLNVTMGAGIAFFGPGSSTDVTRLNVTAGSSAGSFTLANELGFLEIESVSCTNSDVAITAQNNIDLSGDVVGKTVSLVSTGGNMNSLGTALRGTDLTVSVFSQITASPGGIIDASNSLGLWSNQNLVLQPGILSGGFQQLTLNSLNGNIGLDAGNRFALTNNGLLNIDASASNGSIFLQTTNTQPVTFGTVTCGGTFDYRAQSGNGPVTLSNITAGNNVLVNVAGNTLQIAQGASILASSGDVTIANGGLNKKTDFFNIGNNVTISALSLSPGQGNVTLTIGPVPSPVPVGKNFNKKAITVSQFGGSVIWGKKKWTAKVGPIALNVKGADITFSNAYGKKNGIIGSNVTITADPPVTEESALLTSDKNIRTTGGADVSASSAINSAIMSLPNAVETVDAVSTKSTGYLDFSNLATVDQMQNGLQFAADVDDSFITSTMPGQAETAAEIMTDIPLSTKGRSPLALSDSYNLEHGSLVVIPSKDTVVVTPRGKVKIKANAIAYVNVDASQLSVYDISDRAKGSVVVETGSKSIALCPGRHACITHNQASMFSDVNPVEAMMHRQVAIVELNGGTRAFTSEFSLPSAIDTLMPLKSIMSSRHRLSKDMIKTAAVLMHLAGDAVPFEYHARPRQVALCGR